MVLAQSSEEPPSHLNLTKRIQIRDIVDLARPYFVAYHKDGSVKLSTFHDLSSARTFYEEVSEVFQGKILVDKSKAREVTSRSYGGTIPKLSPEFLNECKEVVRNAGNMALNYFVAFYKDGVRRAAFVDLPSAWEFYESVVPDDFPKVLIDTTRTQALTVAIYGIPQFTKYCKDAGNSINNPTPLCQAPYGVAFHQNNAVAVASFDDLRSAQAFYDVISIEWAKVLVEKSPSGSGQLFAMIANLPNSLSMSLEKLGPKYLLIEAEPKYVLYIPLTIMRLTIPQPSELAVEIADSMYHDVILQCRTSIKEAGFPPTLDAATHVVAFHHGYKIRMAGCIDEPSAEAFYQHVSLDYAKILKHRSHAGELLASDGDIEFIKKCEYVVHKLPCVS
ncbi:hypothetical protein V5O48_009488 [Marasmius crinis-equi]|uniref:Uncharacterized protein n=1 Tax=Marasmius crinis-equi TaxID=585013 RepID=A0ABR3FB66_9AGAR